MATAHHPGGTANTSGAGPINTISATPLEAGHVAASFVYEYISLFGLTDADLINAAAQHQHAHSIRTIESASLGAAYGLTNDLMVSFRLPYVRRTNIREGHHAHGHGGAVSNTVDFRGDTAGIGDLTLLGHWRFFDSRATATEAAVLFGLRVPTGRTNVRDQFGQLFETEFQPGSGSVDPMVGLALTQRFGAWSLDANVLYAVAGSGAQKTNLGDRFQYNAAVSYRLFGYSAQGEPHGHRHGALSHSPAPDFTRLPRQVRPHRHGDDLAHQETAATAKTKLAVDLVLELNGEWHDRQVIAGITDPNSGGNTVYLSPGLRLSYGSVSAFTSVGIPIVNHMNGLQSRPDYRVVSGLAVSF